ncbi:MAG: stage V sporulation protein AD [Oscillospiraceae bacterium]|nr:stage V sporulation protein AD [Oscillospiraceae bacterium]
MERCGRQSFWFRQEPGICSWASIAGRKEGQGPLADRFDQVLTDDHLGQASWEQAEKKLQERSLELALKKIGKGRFWVQLVVGGDLLNQCVATSFALRDQPLPFLGVYGACSTMAESLLIAGMAVSGGAAHTAAAITSSHFATAERQYRLPLVYGGQRSPSAQWTATASGCVLLTREPQSIRLESATVGKVADWGITDAANMGAAMAPAAFETILTHLEDLGRGPEDYDLIVTGDLGQLGSSLLLDLFDRQGVSLTHSHRDCGVMLFSPSRQDVHAGASGCGCSASVLCSELLGRMQEGSLRRLLFCATGALLSPLTSQQGETIPGICHAVSIIRED